MGAIDEREEAYQRLMMESARATYKADRPYLRMAKEAGISVETQVDCERFEQTVDRRDG